MKRVLIIDDCQEFSEVVKDFLTDAGYEVALARDQETALVVCDNSVFDVILCDVVLPYDDGMSDINSDSAMAGVHLMHLLSKKCPQVPIVAISGQVTGVPLQGIARFGAVRILAKPFTQAQLLQLLTEVVHEKSCRMEG